MPPSDAFFRHIYGLGTVGDVDLKRFWVFDPNDSGEIEDRYRRLLGPSAKQRFQYFAEDFTDAIVRLGQTFKL
jgi:hypothetical protein